MKLVCTRCGERFTPALGTLSCPACGEGLVVVEPPAVVATPMATPASIWEFADVLPAVPSGSRVTLGEGGTPLLHVGREGARRWVKWEGSGPTLSYKDRFNAVNASVAASLGAAGIAMISTGNAGLSAAAYGAAAGLRVRVVSTPDIPPRIAEQIVALGGDLRVVPRDNARSALRRALEDGWFPGSRSVPAIDVTPFGCEGYKTIAYEIVGALGHAPTAVVVPVGGGDGVYGIGRGFHELHAGGVIDVMPRLYGARTQSARAASIAFDQVGSHARAIVADSGGSFVHVDDGEIGLATAALAGVGLSAEPASACAWAAADTLAASESIDGDVVSVITGHGLKWGVR